MTFYIQRVEGELHCDVVMFSKNTFVAVIQHHHSGTDGETIFHIYCVSDINPGRP